MRVSALRCTPGFPRLSAFRLVVFLAVCVAPCAHANSTGDADDRLLYDVALQRATLVVDDLEQALAFYRDALGLPVARILELRRDSTRESLGLPATARVRFATLGPDENSPGQLGLLEITGAPVAALAQPEPPQVAIGQMLLVWRVSDAVRARDAALARGATLITDVKSFANREGQEVVIAAPEGTRIQLVEFPD